MTFYLKLFCLLFLLILATQFDVYGQWSSTNGPKYAAGFTKIEVNGDYVFANSEIGGTYFTKDNGKNWKEYKIGNDSSKVNWITINKNLIFAQTSNGMMHSTDSGKNWLSSSNGVINSKIYSCLTKDSTLLAQTWNELFRSTDNGMSWSSRKTTQNYTSLAEIDETWFVSISGEGLEKSTDFGESWIPSDSGVTSNFVNDFLVIDSVVYISTGDGNFKSTDKGLSWIGPDYNFPGLVHCSLYKDSIIFVGTDSGILRSSNNGITWESIYKGLVDSKYIYSIAANNECIFAASPYGLFFSNNNGELWNCIDIQTGITPINKIIVKDSLIFVASENGIFYSANDGKNWSACNSGLKSYYINSLIVKDSILYAGTPKGLFNSLDDGMNWHQIDSSGATNVLFVKDSIIYADIYNAGIKFSKNNGESWELLTDDYPSFPRFPNCIEKNNKDMFYIASNKNETTRKWRKLEYQG